MREVKFRGIRKDNGEWVYGYYFALNCTDYNNGKGETRNKTHMIYENNRAHCVDPSTVGEYTGLKDKNEKEIYEGDICKYDSKGYAKINTGEIRFFNDFGCWGINAGGKPLGSSGSSTPYRPYSWKSYRSFEIIGNIHEEKE